MSCENTWRCPAHRGPHRVIDGLLPGAKTTHYCVGAAQCTLVPSCVRRGLPFPCPWCAQCDALNREDTQSDGSSCLAQGRLKYSAPTLPGCRHRDTTLLMGVRRRLGSLLQLSMAFRSVWFQCSRQVEKQGSESAQVTLPSFLQPLNPVRSVCRDGVATGLQIRTSPEAS